MKSKQGFKLRKLGNEYILVGESVEQINFNKMITMNETAAFLWKKVENGEEFTARELADYLLEEYEVTSEQALADSEKTVETWKQAGIIE